MGTCRMYPESSREDSLEDKLRTFRRPLEFGTESDGCCGIGVKLGVPLADVEPPRPPPSLVTARGRTFVCEDGVARWRTACSDMIFDELTKSRTLDECSQYDFECAHADESQH